MCLVPALGEQMAHDVMALPHKKSPGGLSTCSPGTRLQCDVFISENLAAVFLNRMALQPLRMIAMGFGLIDR